MIPPVQSQRARALVPTGERALCKFVATVAPGREARLRPVQYVLIDSRSVRSRVAPVLVDRTWTVRGLTIDSQVPDLYVCDLIVAGRSQFARPGPIPVAAFASTDPFGALLDGDVVPADGLVELVVLCDGPRSVEFRAAVTGPTLAES